MKMGNEKDSTHDEIIICLRSFKRLKNVKGDIERHFNYLGFEAREVLFEKDTGRRGGSYTAVVSLAGKNTSSILKNKFLSINKRRVHLEGLKVDSVHLDLTPMVTKLPPRPNHAAICALKRLSFDAWHQVCRHLDLEDLRRLQVVCSCGYALVRKLELQTRRCLSLRTEEFVPCHRTFRHGTSWDLLCGYGHLQRYLLRFNLESLQRLQIQMTAFERQPLPRNFFAFLACHCPQLTELCLEKVTFQTFRQDMVCSTSFEHLTHLEIACVYPRQFGCCEVFPSEALASVVKSAKKLKHVQLSRLLFRRSFFHILPEGVESLVLDGRFCGMPSDVLLSRFNNTLRRLCMTVAMQRNQSPPAVSLLQLAVLRCLKLHCSTIQLPVERRPWSSLQHLELHNPPEFSQDTVEALGTCCPALKFLLLRREYLELRQELDLRPLAALEELRMPQYSSFELFTGRLPPSLRVLQIRMWHHLVLEPPESDRHWVPVHQYFEFLLTLPQLEYLEFGTAFYPRRSFLIEIMNRRRRFPFLTIAQKTIRDPVEEAEQLGKSFRFLEYHRPDKAVRAGLRLQRDICVEH